jgi:hypothetical protein
MQVKSNSSNETPNVMTVGVENTASVVSKLTGHPVYIISKPTMNGEWLIEDYLSKYNAG